MQTFTISPTLLSPFMLAGAIAGNS